MAKLFQPTLVIGIGGTGKGIILALKKMIAENSPRGMADYPLLKFLSIDTDTSLPNVNTSIQTIKASELTLNKAKETFSLHADFNTVPDLKERFKDIAAWFPDSLKHNLTPAELEKGAGQRKPIGRFSFAWNADTLKPRLEQLLRNPVDVDTAKQWGIGESNLAKFTNVFICGSICGGTGSGTFLDLAYLIRNIASHIANRSIYIYGMLALASIFEGIQGDANIKPNCYASLVELDHFMNPFTYGNEYRRFYPAYKNIGPKQWDYSKSSENGPFDFPFLFDKTNSAGFSLNSSKAFSEMVARFIYLLTGHEVAEQWQSMDNNVRKLLDVSYNKQILQKPNNYRSMGTFSVMFPRRMAIQMCAYKLADVYLEKILDDSYNPQEISNLVDNFMNDTKFNPQSDLLQGLFDNYADQDSSSDSFASYIDNRKEEFLSECEDADKKEIVQKVRDWKESMDKIVLEFKQQNSVTSRNLREEFLGQFVKRISGFVDLTLRKDETNKANNEPKMVRGSIVRAQKFVKTLLDVYTDAAEKFRKEKDSTIDAIKQAEEDFKARLDDLDSVVDGMFSTKKKISENLEDTLNACTTYLNAKRENFIAEWCHQLFTGILESGILRYNGLITELENENQLLQRGINEFKSIHEDVKNYLNENKNYEANYLCDVLFDYKDDVEGVYQNLMAEKGEDYIFEDLSRHLKDKDDNFGDAYENLKDLTKGQMLLSILRCTEDYFKEPISRINISDKLLKNDEKLNLLLNGNYYNNANVYLGLDGGELSRVGLNLDSSKFFAITIPDIYEACPCRGIAGSNSVGKRCPVDEDEEKFKGDKACPYYPNCLKKRILDNAPNNLAIVPTEETAEVNIMTTVAGFPLHAVSSVMYDCKPMYEKQKNANKEENERTGRNEETLQMFGPIEFTDLAEKSEDPLVLMKPFKKTVMLAIALERLVIHPLSVDFITKQDIDAGRREHPSLHLGESISDVFKKFQSTRIEDQAAIKQIGSEMKVVRDAALSNEDLKAKLGEKLKSSYEKFNKDIPEGLNPTDLDIIDEISRELCGLELIQKTASSDLW